MSIIAPSVKGIRRIPAAVLLLGLVVCLAAIPTMPARGAEDPPHDTSATQEAAGCGQVLFDGRTLDGWEVLQKYDYANSGNVYIADGWLVMEAGRPGTGVRWTGPFPRCNYEVVFEGKRVAGSDFFCAVTFPLGNDALTLVLGGWGGSVVGLSSINGEPAAENETCRYIDFEQGRSYRIRLRVTADRVDAWIDTEHVISLPTEHRQFSIRWEVEPCLPFGLATWRTTGAVRNLRLRLLAGDSDGSGSAAAPRAARECPE